MNSEYVSTAYHLPIPAHSKASQRQFDLIKSLLTERELNTELNDWVVAARHFAVSGTLSWDAAHQLINALLAAPKLADAPTAAPVAKGGEFKPFVPAGRYALVEPSGDIKFYHVSKRGYVQVRAGDTLYPVSHRQHRRDILVRIGADLPNASRMYGQELGQCGVCGRTLTDADSRAAGIGPICQEKTGW